MGKYALLIGVGEYGKGLSPLPAAANDVAALKEVLENPNKGGVDEVKLLVNPAHDEMRREIDLWLQKRSRTDLSVLFFSGHGLKDARRNLHFAACNTENELILSTAVPASFVRECIRNSKSKYQVLILDCCFSGAFGDLVARDAGEVNLQEQLGAEGHVVLASTSWTDYSFEEKGASLSIYTRYLIEGISSGAADANGDGVITVDELHRYAERKVQETSPVMNPKIITLKDEGYGIQIACAPQNDPILRYRQVVEKWVTSAQLSSVVEGILDTYRQEYSVSELDARAVENEVLKPYKESERKKQKYQSILVSCLKEKRLVKLRTLEELLAFRVRLQLKPEDAVLVEREVLSGQTLKDIYNTERVRKQQTNTTTLQRAAETAHKRSQREQEAPERRADVSKFTTTRPARILHRSVPTQHIQVPPEPQVRSNIRSQSGKISRKPIL